MSTEHRRQFTDEQKVGILREHLLEGKAVSDVCDAHGLNPTVLYRWQKEFFENGAAAFDRKRGPKPGKAERRVAALQLKLREKDEVISEIMAELIAQKKRNGEI